MAALFLAEKTPEDKLSGIDRMLYTLVRDEDRGAARELFLWLRDILGESRPLEESLPVLATMEEEYTMLEETIRRHDKKLYAQGKTEGRTEGRTEVARRMLERGMTLDVIADITGLPENEISAAAKEKPTD